MNSVPKTLAVDIWSDIMCPWCAIGCTQFLKAVDLVAGEIAVEVRFLPFELNPDLPAEGKEQDRHLAEVYGRSLAEVAGMRANLLAAADNAGFPMNFPDPAMIWNTFASHRLLRWALAESGGTAQTRLKMALFAAHFQQQRSVADVETLLDIAAEQGFDRAQAAAALADKELAVATRTIEEQGRQAGINSVPSFILDGKYLVQGAREPEDYAAMLRQVAGLQMNA